MPIGRSRDERREMETSSLFWCTKPDAVCIAFCSAASLVQPCDRSGSAASTGISRGVGACLARPGLQHLPPPAQGGAAVLLVAAASRRARPGSLPRDQGAPRQAAATWLAATGDVAPQACAQGRNPSWGAPQRLPAST